MKRSCVRTGLVTSLGLLGLTGCGNVCGDDGLVWQQANNPACQALTADDTGDSSTTSDTTTTDPPTTTEPPTTTMSGGMWCKDGDGDGHGDPTMCQPDEFPGSVPNDDDCADGNPNAYPGAAEKESQTACMEDTDDDGWGDDMPPEGVTPGTDCNDDNSTIYPGAASLESMTMCLQDSDGDGYGDGMPDDPDVPPGLDCADDDPNTFPGAAPHDSADACMTDADGDDWGDDSPDAPGAVPGTDCADDNANAFPGAAENDSPEACMEDEDNDGWGDDMPPENVNPGNDCDDADVNTGPGAAQNEVDPLACHQDADDDGYGDNMPDDPDAVPGADCDDGDANTFPGAAPNDDPTACMTDADDDDWGATNPNPGVDPGTDCNDADAEVHLDCADCTPNESVCMEDALHTCNPNGNGVIVTNCEFGCDDQGLKCWDQMTVDAGDSVCTDPNVPIQLNAVTMGGDGQYAWSWSPAMGLDNAMIQNPMATPPGPQTYTVDVSDGEGNMASDSVTVYLKNQSLTLDPQICTTQDFSGTDEVDPATKWVWNPGPKELCQTVNGKASALFCGWELNNATITGTFSVKTTDDDDWTGFMWGIQDTNHFYLFTWKQVGQAFNTCGGMLPGGMQVKVIDVQNPMQTPLTCADRHKPSDTANSKLLVPVEEFTTAGWKDNTEYVFELTHKSNGEMEIIVREKANMQVVAMKSFMDTTYPSGKFGMYTKSQIQACFSNFVASCVP